MADELSQRPPSFRIGSLRNFLPLSVDDSVLTWGQRYPSLIRDKSTASLPDNRVHLSHRKLSSYSNDTDDEPDVERGNEGCEEREEGRPRRSSRKMSTGSQILMTPQMRSIRLIGNSNPRYQW